VLVEGYSSSRPEKGELLIRSVQWKLATYWRFYVLSVSIFVNNNSMNAQLFLCESFWRSNTYYLRSLFEDHYLLLMIAEMHRSIRWTIILSLQQMITSHRTRLGAMSDLSMMLYNSLTHKVVLMMLVIMTHWTHKNEQNNLNMTSYHDLKHIKDEICAGFCQYDVTHSWHCSLILHLLAMIHWVQKQQ